MSTPLPLAEPLALRIPDACRAVGCGKTWLYAEAKKGNLKLTRLGGRTVVSMAELRRLIGEAA